MTASGQAIAEGLLWANRFLCIQDHEGMPSPTPPARAPAVCTPDRSQFTLQPAPDPVVTPIPHQPNLTRGCSKFHKVASGQFCADVASEYGISLEDF
ncbi:LysM domain-containing protein [Colletotrichum gloeosporioides Cg-14]|uniref:LysM domain-containing protein n=1 Tax=Colletotrichum gloeosporioides (strain Cg-14) TaxID=1237896 RepID=T0KW82_COLGC|nr:LysM domain-containing protein [Colletotrichum gloeosporioides Cg-14]